MVEQQEQEQEQEPLEQEQLEQEQQAVAKRYRDKSGRDMVLSLLALLVPILVAGALLRACGSAEPTVVATAPAIADARAAQLFAVVEPRGLGDGWRPVQATFRRGDGWAELRLGYLTPSGGELLLVQSNDEPGALLARELGDEVRPQGEVSIDGQPWTRSLVRGEEQALVRIDERRTVVLVGRAGLEELTDFAASLS